MKTVTFDIRPPSAAKCDFTDTWKAGVGQASERISFASPELLWQGLTAKRWTQRPVAA